MNGSWHHHPRSARFALAVLLLWTSLPAAAESAERLRVRVLESYPHDATAYTQGLLWHGGRLYESTGRYGASSLRRVALVTGAVTERWALDAGFFAEGLALVEGRLIQLTWQSGLAFVYDAGSIAAGPVEQFTYGGMGWGLAWDGKRLVMSDGSAELTFRDPVTFQPGGVLTVRLDGRPVKELNELEVAEGMIYANVWQQDWIARIDPDSGAVTAVIDASGLLSAAESRRAEVLNGIAYDPDTKTFLITGKYWPKIFRVVFEPAS